MATYADALSKDTLHQITWLGLQRLDHKTSSAFGNGLQCNKTDEVQFEIRVSITWFSITCHSVRGLAVDCQ